jgi:hypothetical protein
MWLMMIDGKQWGEAEKDKHGSFSARMSFKPIVVPAPGGELGLDLNYLSRQRRHPRMDPLTIATGCVSLVATISKLSISISGFVRDVRGARSDLDTVSRELLSLKTVLELLAEDAADSNASGFSETLRKQVTGIITNCNGVLEEIEGVLTKLGGSRIDKAARWALTGQNDVSKLRSSLEAHKSALEIALDMVAL